MSKPKKGETDHWVPDEDVISCPSCSSKFSLTKRKHHCRHCGNVFCGPCCNKKVPLPHLGFESHVRVCDNCYKQRMQTGHLTTKKQPNQKAADPDGLVNKIYYFPDISRDQAERFLSNSPINTFLVRRSASESNAWVLSTKRKGDNMVHSLLRIKTLKPRDVTNPISKAEEEYTIDLNGETRTFPSIEFLADELDIDPIEVDEDDEETAFYMSTNAPAKKANSPPIVKKPVTKPRSKSPQDSTNNAPSPNIDGRRRERKRAAEAYRAQAAAEDSPSGVKEIPTLSSKESNETSTTNNNATSSSVASSKPVQKQFRSVKKKPVVQKHLERLATLADEDTPPPGATERGTPHDGDVACLAALAAGTALRPWSYKPKPFGVKDVDIRVEYCGVCKSDLHQIENDWKMASFPHVPGHEVVGVVIAVGEQVTTLRVGDRVGLGAHCWSCSKASCRHCSQGREQLCPQVGFTAVSELTDETGTHLHRGGFASMVRTDARFCVKVPAELPLESVAPLLCAGVTVYAAMTRIGITADSKVAVTGIGGLGHLAIMFALAMGAQVTAVSASMDKQPDAKRLGAHNFVYSKDSKQMEAVADNFDFVLCTVSGSANVSRYVSLLRSNGTLCLLGLPKQAVTVLPTRLVFDQISITGSAGGSVADLRATLEFAARHKVKPEVEVFPMSSANEAVARLRDNKARYRVVLKAETQNHYVQLPSDIDGLRDVIEADDSK